MRTPLFGRLSVSLGIMRGLFSSQTLAEDPDLVERGAKLFAAATFRGNGRTCQTCHTKHWGVFDSAGEPFAVA